MKFTVYNLSVLILLLLLLPACAGNQGQGDRPVTWPEVAPALQPTPTLALVNRATPPPPTPPVTRPLDGEPLITAVIETAAAVTPSATAVPSATPTPAATPTATPRPAERLALARTHLHNENFAAAREQFLVIVADSTSFSDAERQEALLGLARTYLADGNATAAASVLNQLLALTAAAPTTPQTDPAQAGSEQGSAYYYLALAYSAQSDCQSAIGAYLAYLSLHPDMAAYISPRIGRCQVTLGDPAAALSAYETAAAAPAHRLVMLENRLQLANLYRQTKDYPAAVNQYDAILAFAQTENTRGQATYLAGYTEILAGNEQAGYQRYLQAVNQFPRAAESHPALVALLDAGYPVDDFQRGLVNYYARSYTPAVAAFSRYLAAFPDNHREDTHLFLAWSYEGLGNVTTAVTELDTYIEAHPADPVAAAQGWLEKARLQARAGLRAEAAASYGRFVELYPRHQEAPLAAWWAAVFTERTGATAAAMTLYRQMADAYPRHNDAPKALLRVATLAYQAGDQATAVATWQEIISRYPNHEYAAAARIWLIRTLPAAEAAAYQDTAAARRGVHYYHLRAYDLAQGVAVFAPPPAINLEFDEAAELAEAETWLRNWLELGPGVNVSALSPRLAGDERLIRGEKLWRLGLYEEAKRELEAVRTDYSQNALLSYQLALYFRDLGLYRSSIMAAAAVMQLGGANPFNAPRLIARLAYPVYYADQIVVLAEQYGYDPLLQFALVRQESLFESFAVSHAAAQGLSQVIPDTGAYIAQRLNWPDYENALLYRPYIGLAFGAYYLQQQLDAFDGDVYAALAAYNAGPGNARRWYNVAPHDPDLYVEMVNFAETRLYIERIYSGHAIYRYLYGEK
jgi:soluble lytic murein transglycosylase